MTTLSIYRAVRSSRITQKFGDNQACVYPSGEIVAKSRGLCPAGSRDFYKSQGMLGHNGYDNQAIHGETVVYSATFDGRMKIEKDRSGGIGVDVISTNPLDFVGKPPAGLICEKTSVNGIPGFKAYVKMRYWHLKSPIGYDGKLISFGTPVGLADNTGDSSGDHLHWAPKWCTKEGVALCNDNGYYGAFDPTPYYNHSQYAGDVVSNLGIKPQLSAQELKEMASQLSMLQKLVLQLRELMSKM